MMGLHAFERLDKSKSERCREKVSTSARKKDCRPFGKSNSEIVGATYAPVFQCAEIILAAHLGEQGTISEIKKKGACPDGARRHSESSFVVIY
jgi:hypothetical protein